MASRLGDQLYKEGYKGVFCMDFLLDTDDGTPYLGEVNPRISGASPLTNLITAHYGGVPLFLFHLLEYLDVDYEINLRKVQNRWNEYDFWSQLVLKQTFDKVRQLTHAPQAAECGRMDKYGGISFDRADLDWTNVIDNDEAYYLRVYREGDYTYKGADLGIIVSRGRMQTEGPRAARARQGCGPRRSTPSFTASSRRPCPSCTRIRSVRSCSDSYSCHPGLEPGSI